jgi:hypothetical protein
MQRANSRRAVSGSSDADGDADGTVSPAPGDWSVATPVGVVPPLQAARTVMRRRPAAPARKRVRDIDGLHGTRSLMTRLYVASLKR